MDRGDWWATVHGVAESEKTYQLNNILEVELYVITRPWKFFFHFYFKKFHNEINLGEYIWHSSIILTHVTSMTTRIHNSSKTAFCCPFVFRPFSNPSQLLVLHHYSSEISTMPFKWN